jgi:hypothetical protein
MADTDDLTKLNEDTFVAEARGTENWDSFLYRVLADDFRLKRANPAILPQDKHQMINHIRYDTNTLKRNIFEVKPFVDRDYGVVTCVITLGDPPKDEEDRKKKKQFHNLKVFVRNPDLPEKWQCVYWRVTELKGQ